MSDEPIPPEDLPPGEVNIDSIDTFTRGYCAALAYAVHLRTGWRIGLVLDELGEWLHAVAAMPDGRFLDIEGIATRHELITRWKPRSKDMTGFPAEDLDTFTIVEIDTKGLWRRALKARYTGREDVIAPFVDTLLALVADDRLTDTQANNLLLHHAHNTPERTHA